MHRNQLPDPEPGFDQRSRFRIVASGCDHSLGAELFLRAELFLGSRRRGQRRLDQDVVQCPGAGVEPQRSRRPCRTPSTSRPFRRRIPGRDAGIVQHRDPALRRCIVRAGASNRRCRGRARGRSPAWAGCRRRPRRRRRRSARAAGHSGLSQVFASVGDPSCRSAPGGTCCSPMLGVSPASSAISSNPFISLPYILTPRLSQQRF